MGEGKTLPHSWMPANKYRRNSGVRSLWRTLRPVGEEPVTSRMPHPHTAPPTRHLSIPEERGSTRRHLAGTACSTGWSHHWSRARAPGTRQRHDTGRQASPPRRSCPERRHLNPSSRIDLGRCSHLFLLGILKVEILCNSCSASLWPPTYVFR